VKVGTCYSSAVAAEAHYDEMIQIPRAVRFPIELVPPPGFDPERTSTWPRVPGRLEWHEGRLLYMPPCGEVQQATVTDVVITLGAWVRHHREFVLGTNEAGMRLQGSTRAADAAIWRRADFGFASGVARKPPLLAVEVAGADDPESTLIDKARWYLEVGVSVVWLVLPESRDVVVVTAAGTHRAASHELLPPHPDLPRLSVRVSDFFLQQTG
jgi:Uma2 family endonuclease